MHNSHRTGSFRKFPDDLYTIETELGRGGCGAVFKAWHNRLGKHIVLKEQTGSSKRAIEACRNEAEALKNIKNAHIPQVYDFFIDNDSSYTVMEYINGTGLDKLLLQGKQFTPAKVLKIYSQLALALAGLHEKDICHRDIKPSNIIYMPGGSVYLIDFNSALVSGNNTKTVSRSFGYASPEQLAYFHMCEKAYFERTGKAGARPGNRNPMQAEHISIDWKLSDIYSLGAAMYHIFTGKFPPCGEDAEKPGFIKEMLKAAHGSEAGHIAKIIERSMHPESARRYQSAKHLCVALWQCRKKSISPQ